MEFLIGMAIFLFYGYFLFNILTGYIADNLRKKRILAEKKQELDSWLLDQEAKSASLNVYPDDWGMRRKYIAEKYNYTCQSCGKRGFSGFHVHHILALSKGGNNELNNLTFLCKWCHEN